jgi:signal transduction histidine kinase
MSRRLTLTIFYGCTLGCSAMAWLSATWQLPEQTQLLLAGSCGLGCLAGGVAVGRVFQAGARWEQKLSHIVEQDFLDVDAIVQRLQPSGGCSAADRAWNLMVSAAGHWSCLRELERQVAEQLQTQSARESPPLLDSLSDGVATTNAEGAITLANSAFASICGVATADLLLGKSLIGVLTDSPELAEQIRQLRPMAAVEWQTGSDDAMRILNARFRPGRRSDGADTAAIWTVRDVTQQRLADAMKDRFLATATHEFRTPLANIRAYAESLEGADDLDADSRKQFFNVIQSESIRLSQLVDDLLDISRMQAGAMALESNETDLPRLIEEVTLKVEGQIREKSLELRCELPPKYPPKVCLDKGKLSAALVNLLGNAAKYTPAGGCVTFRVEASEQRIIFTVADTGYGISEQDLPHIFDRFYRSDDDRVQDLSGSGLGLALTQEVARLHGGEITVESKLNHGSTFCMTIPLESHALHA